MKIKSHSFYYGILFFSLLTFQATAQKTTASSWTATNWSHSSKNCHHILSIPAQCKWEFPELHGTMEGTVISYERMQKSDKTLYAASVAIVKTGNDQVRILLLSNYGDLKQGQHIKVTPDKEPSVDVAVPIDRDFCLAEEKKKGKPLCRINSYDETVVKTIWGKMVN
jgi:hypothetical protein